MKKSTLYYVLLMLLSSIFSLQASAQQRATCKEFNNGKDGNIYVVKGVISSIENDKECKWHLKDATGFIYIDGLKDERDFTHEFSYYGYKAGDTVTVAGTRTSYSNEYGTWPSMNNAVFAQPVTLLNKYFHVVECNEASLKLYAFSEKGKIKMKMFKPCNWLTINNEQNGEFTTLSISISDNKKAAREAWIFLYHDSTTEKDAKYYGISQKGNKLIGKTIEGVDMTFRMITDSTCEVSGERENSEGYLVAIDPNTKGHITIPAQIDGFTVTNMEGSFTNCKDLTGITIPEGMLTMYSSFYGCAKLTDIPFPKSLYQTHLDLYKETPWYNSLSEGPVYISHCFAGYKGVIPTGTHLVIPEGIATIPAYIFEHNHDNNNQISGITLPSTLEFMAEESMCNCGRLRTIICKSTNTGKNIDKSTFYQENWSWHDTYSNATLIVPASSINLYKNAEPWKNFKNIVADNSNVANDLAISVNDDLKASMTSKPSYTKSEEGDFKGSTLVKAKDNKYQIQLYFYLDANDNSAEGIAEGDYPIRADKAAHTVAASQGSKSSSYIYTGNKYYYLVSGNVNVSRKDGKLIYTIDAVNFVGAKINFTFSESETTGITEINAPVSVNRKQISNGNILIINGNKKYNALGIEQ